MADLDARPRQTAPSGADEAGDADFPGDGELAKLIRGYDWGSTPLGPIGHWPQSLRTAVGLLLPAAAEIVLFWGPEFIAIYNDAYAPTIGDKHPRALGRPARENWAELWDDLGPLLQSVRDTGETVVAKDRPFYIERRGYPETVYFDISYSAVPDESGAVAGVLCIVAETTERVLSEKRNIADRERLTQMFDQSPTFMAMLRGPEHVFEVANSAYLALVGERDEILGKTVRQALPDIAGQGFFELLDQVYRSGQPHVGLGTSVQVRRKLDEPAEDRFVDFVYQPMRDSDGQVTGILVQGSDVTERVRAEDALRASEEQLRVLADSLPLLVSYVDRDLRYRFVNRTYEEWFGKRSDALIGQHISNILGEDSFEGRRGHIDRVFEGEAQHFEGATPTVDGSLRMLDIDYVPRRAATGEIEGFFVVAQDVTARRALFDALDAQRHVLELAVQDTSLEDSLSALVRTVEEHSTSGVLASVLLFDEEANSLRHGAAPSLPQTYCRVIDGVEIGPAAGSCGTAAYRREPVEVREIATDPLWADFKDVAAAADLRACWSTPIFSSTGKLLGTFAMYYREPRAPADSDLELVELVKRSAGLIIERKQAEQALRASEARFRAVFENAGVGLLLVDRDWTIFEVNQRYCEIVGREECDLTGTSSLAFTHADDLERSAEAMAALPGRPGGQISFEKRYIGTDGRIIWVRSNLARISGSDGQERYLKIIEDVTERRAAEKALEDERRNLETLNSVGASLSGELDLERVVQMVTDAGVELTGAQFGAFFYNVANDAGESYMLYTISGVDRSEFDKFPMPRNTRVFGPTFAGEGIVRSEDITKDPRYGRNPPYHGMPEGHLPVVSYLALPVIGRTGEVIGGLFFGHPEAGQFQERHEHLMEGIAAQAAVAIDNARLFGEAQREIERRLEVEQALTGLNATLETRVVEEIDRRAKAEEALRQAQKMETVGQLSGGIAHDFNNLLQVIHGNLSMLQRAIPESEAKLHRSVANALSGADRAAALTKRLLAFSRRQPLEPRPVDVNRMIGEMIELLHRTLGETIVINTDLGDGIPNAFVDSNQLENALLNLAINARDAMPQGGQLEIATSRVDLEGKASDDHPDAAPGCYVRVEVRDTGEGMSEDVLARAVEPFFSTKEVGHGTGLGLSMVYGFVRQSGGHLALQSELGTGTSVALYLPCSDLAAGPQRSAKSDAELPRGKGERVLLCEDDEEVRQFSSETLRELGYDVTEAREAGSALAALREGRFDLLFTDVVLPGAKTGADLAREAREVQPDLKVLFTTGYARSALDEEQKGEQPMMLLQKPFRVEQLAEKLRQILD